MRWMQSLRVNTLCIVLLTACTQAHIISIAVPKPTRDISTLSTGKYTLDDSHASITMKVSHLGLSNYTMQFTNFDANLYFNKDKPELSKVNATITMSSIETNYPNEKQKDFDKELAYAPSWFNANVFPQATFVSESIKITEENKGIVYGKLTFLGITKPLAMNVTFNGGFTNKPFVGLPALGFSANAKLNRSEWGLTNLIPAIGDEVDIQIECEFHKEDEK